MLNLASLAMEELHDFKSLNMFSCGYDLHPGNEADFFDVRPWSNASCHVRPVQQTLLSYCVFFPLSTIYFHPSR